MRLEVTTELSRGYAVFQEIFQELLTIAFDWHTTATGSTSKFILLAVKHLRLLFSSHILERSLVAKLQMRLEMRPKHEGGPCSLG